MWTTQPFNFKAGDLFSATQGGEGSGFYIQWEQSVDDLNGGYSKVVERILPGSP